MRRNSYDNGSPGAWLRYARSDLALASITPPHDVLLDTLCYHAQQAVEKSIKAVLVANKVEFPPTHNLKVLVESIPEHVDVPPFVKDAVRLTPYAVSSRYPDDMEPVTDVAEHEDAVTLAKAVLDWATTTIR